ncbi:hypothetical protein ScalyP_jg8538 [Parmales sp. scaly parma]|nr:hypothetical protein ScalyP_jg8538 [Parmales sp. scaly parma]
MQGLLFFLGFSNLLSNAFFRDPTISPHTNIGDPSRSIFVVTTAALPWMTGTAVNPLQRAAHLVTPARAVEHSTVTLLLPWLERLSDRRLIYGSEPEFNFDTANEQENYIREWLMFVCCLPYAAKNLKILWYTAWVNPLENSIYSMGDITALIDPSIAKSSICILEEPEHLNWYRPPTNTEWTTLFPHVVGIVHTNYFAYANEQPMAVVRAPGMRLLCSWMIRAHCHRVVMLSSTLGSFAEEKECVSNVHGVRNTFLQIGKKAPPPNNNNNNNNNVYFIGKTLKSKGIPHLMELLEYASATQNLTLPVDLYGDGPDRDELEQLANSNHHINMTFYPPTDHSNLAKSHQIFINPSITEVLCTTVSEALAMGKFVVVPAHPSNTFFVQFPNCLTFSSKEEFVERLLYALSHEPEVMTEELRRVLSWEAATERLVVASLILRDKESSQINANVNVNVPSLIPPDRQTDVIKNLYRARKQYMQFRATLRDEINSSRSGRLLPKWVKDKILLELDKKLDIDFDFDEIISSPKKLSIKLSPAELDKRLLSLYKVLGKGEIGDILRVVGGGAAVGRQEAFMKEREKAEREKGVNIVDLIL